MSKDCLGIGQPKGVQSHEEYRIDKREMHSCVVRSVDR